VRQRGRSRVAADEWMGLREATTILGVSPSTLRRWADEGAVRTFVTPGGHRRFSRSAVESLLPGARRARGADEPLGESPAQMSRAYRRELSRDTADDLGLASALGSEDRSRFRDHGRRIVRAALSALETTDADLRERDLAEATEASAEYGRAAASIGLPCSTTVATYLRFRRPFLAELSALARRRGLDAGAATELTDRARDMFDRLLVATIRAQEAATSAAWASPRPAPGSPDLEVPVR
jgi:excisionase family DNA binding protein